MATKNPLTDIVMAAANLKGAAPEFFTKLTDAVKSYEASLITEIMTSDEPRDVFRAQGGVKTIQSLRKHLQECTELRATYERRDPNAKR